MSYLLRHLEPKHRDWCHVARTDYSPDSSDSYSGRIRTSLVPARRNGAWPNGLSRKCRLLRSYKSLVDYWDVGR
jgi:hypothetical protein